MMRAWTCRRLAVALALACGAAISTITFAAAPLPMLAAKGTQFVTPDGQPVILKGCNLGNYLMLEGWMFGGTFHSDGRDGFRDGATVYRTLRQRFGDEKAAHLVELYRNSWITPRDLANIKSFGFNVVRLPFDYRLIQDDAAPFATKPDAFRWLDHAVDMAEAAGLYVVLDLHGVPGGQSNEDHTGEAGQDKIWNSAEDQQRTVDVWKLISHHFKDRSCVAAYDLMNEPYGNHKEDVKPVLARLMPEVTKAIRANGDNHIVFFPAGLNTGIEFYGNPTDQGLTNVAFTEHFYAGMFGGKPALETQARLLNHSLPEKHDYIEKVKSPYFVGEFNVVLASEDPNRMMRAYYDRFAEYGWAATMWSYKLISAKGGVGSDGWYLVTNTEPLPKLNIDNSSYEEIESFFASLATMPLAANESLKENLTTATPRPIYLASSTTVGAKAPPAEVSGPSLLTGSFDAWQMTAVGVKHASDGLTIDAAGGTAWQEAAATPGGRYRFAVKAHVAGQNATGALELRLESTIDGRQIILNSQRLDFSKLNGDAITVDGTAAAGQVRVVIATVPAKGGSTGEVVLKDATLKVVSPD